MQIATERASYDGASDVSVAGRTVVIETDEMRRLSTRHEYLGSHTTESRDVQ